MTPQDRKQTDRSETRYSIVVPDALREFFLGANLMGQGGFQSLGRMLAERLRITPVLRLDEAEFRRVVRYANHYGEGGFQAKLRQLIALWTEQNFNRL